MIVTLEKVSLIYPIQPRAVLILKKAKVWRIFSEKCQFVLKRMDFAEAELEFITACFEHLKEKGFLGFTPLVKTIDGKPFGYIDGVKVILTEFVDGREADFKNKFDIFRCGRVLAHFHNQGEGFHYDEFLPRLKWKVFPAETDKKEKQLIKYGKNLELNGMKDSFDRLFYRFLPYYLEEINKVKPFFVGDEYETAVEEGRTRGGFCHHDLIHHNFILRDDRDFLIDFDYAISDIYAHDLANFLQKVLKKNDWNPYLAIDALLSYEEIRPLGDRDRKIILNLLMFPNDFWQVAFARYDEMLVTKHRTETKLRAWIKDIDLRQRCLEELSEKWG